MATPYTGNPNGSAHAPSPAPSPGALPIINIPADTDSWNSATLFQQQYEALADFVAFAMQRGSIASFGDGSDGTATLDGTATVSWATKSISTYTLNRDVYAANLTVTGGSTILMTNGYRIYVNNVLTTAAGGKISAAGNNAIANVGGVVGNTGSVQSGAAGGNGGSTGAGSQGGSVTNSLCSGAGGGGAGANGAGGASGAVSALNTTNGSGLHLYSPTTFGWFVAPAGIIAPQGAPGGGGGGAASGVNTGGGGGAGGGVLCVAARSLVLANAADLTAAGGNGFHGIATNAGGGGGGSGGLAVIVYCVATIASGSFSAATNCPAGSGGASGGGTGVAGTSGLSGFLYLTQVS